MPKIIFTDSVKARSMAFKSSFGIDPWQDETPGVWVPDKAANALARDARLVPSMFAGVFARAQALADMPFTIYQHKGDEVKVDDSAAYKNFVGWLPKPSQFLWMVESSLVTFGSAYFFISQGLYTGAAKSLKYWMPESVTPKLDKSSGLVNFHRSVDNQDYTPEQVLQFWLPDPSVEIGPPSMYPFASALAAAEANGAITGWVRDYMKRGAIKAMLLAVDGLPPEGEIERIENWFNRFMAGVRGLYWRVFNASTVHPTVIGDGLDALKGLTVNNDLRYDIHTALGTRHLLEDENFATANARERQFVNFTIMPDARFIEGVLNERMLEPKGLRLRFEPERMNSFEVLKAERAASLANLFDVLIQSVTPDVALQLGMDLLGFDLTEDQKDLFKKGMLAKDQEKNQVEDQPVAVPQDVVKPVGQAGETVSGRDTEKSWPAIVELDKWEKKVTTAGKMVTWHAVDLPDELVKEIKLGSLTFDQARAQLRSAKPLDPEATVVLKGIEQAVKLFVSSQQDVAS